MRMLSEMIDDCQSALGRGLSEEEKDYLFICQITGSWGWQGERNDLSSYSRDDDHSIHGIRHHSTMSGNREPEVGNYRYIAKVGNPIDWQRIREHDASKYIGILLRPEKAAAEICCAQFSGRQIYRVPMSIEQAERALHAMVAGKSLLNAVEMSLGQPMGAVERKLIGEIMRN